MAGAGFESATFGLWARKAAFEDFLDRASLPWSVTICKTPLVPAGYPCLPMAWYIFGTLRRRSGTLGTSATCTPRCALSCWALGRRWPVRWAMVRAYWSIGGMIERHVGGIERSEAYGKALAGELAARLSDEFGRGFDASNLRYIRLFNAFEICDAPRHKSSPPVRLARPEITVELSWTHYRLLTRVHGEEARWFYMNEAIRGRDPPGTGRWSAGARCSRNKRGDDVGGVAVQRLAGTVVAHRGAGVGVAGGFLNIAKWDTGIERRGDERVAQAVG